MWFLLMGDKLDTGISESLLDPDVSWTLRTLVCTLKSFVGVTGLNALNKRALADR